MTLQLRLVSITLPTVLAIAASLTGCNSAPKESIAPSPASSPLASASPIAPSPNSSASPSPSTSSDHSQPKRGGQVVEDGDYHLEFVAAKEGATTHLDLFLQTGDTHTAVPGAIVEAQVQKPDGAIAKVILPYDASGQHYAASIPTTESGEYLVKITAKIKKKTASGRFTFSG